MNSKYILILLFFVSSFCYGQYPVIRTYPGGHNTIYKNLDTSRVIMLVSDTLYNRPISSPIQGSTLYRYPPMYWAFGYEITQGIYISDFGNQIRIGTKIIARLDEMFKEIPKNIFIWQTFKTNTP